MKVVQIAAAFVGSALGAALSPAPALAIVPHPPAPLPYVFHSFPAALRAGWSGSTHSLTLAGHHVGYTTSQTGCGNHGSNCRPYFSVEYWDGVQSQTVEHTDYQYLEHLRMTPQMFAWEVPNPSPTANLLRYLSFDGRPVTVSQRADYGQVATDGWDLAYEVLDNTTYRYDIYFRGKMISAPRNSFTNQHPVLAGGNVLYDGGGRFVLYDGATNRNHDLPLFHYDQLEIGHRLSPDGQTALWMLRDFYDDGSGPPHHVVKVFTLADGRVRTTPITDQPLFDVGFDGEYFVWARSIEGVGGGEMMLTDLADMSSQSIELGLVDTIGDYYNFGTLSQGKLSYMLQDGTVRLYDIAAGARINIGKSGDTAVVNWGDTVAWWSHQGQEHPIVNIAERADQAVLGISDALAHDAARPRLSSDDQDAIEALADTLDPVLAALQTRDYGTAGAGLSDFIDGVEALRGAPLSDARANALREAAERISAALL